MRFLFIIFLIVFTSDSFAQFRSSKFARFRSSRHKNTHEAGTIFFSWGFNRSFYTDSRMKFSGKGHNFELSNIKAEDNQSNRFSGNFYNPLDWTKTQYNIKLGYYFKNKWSMTIALDHMKYQIIDNSGATLDGEVTFTTDEYISFNDNLSFYHGDWYSKSVIIDKNYFNYNTNGGMNYLHLEWAKTAELYNYNTKRPFVISSVTGFGTGIVLSNVNFTYNGTEHVKARSLSGYGASLFTGVRIEFFRQMYLYANVSGGFLHQVNAKTIQSDQLSSARHVFFYSQFDAGLGFFLFKRHKNGCDDCPVW